MAMHIFFNHNGLVTILIGLLLHLCHNGLITILTTSYTRVDAIVFGNSGISGPFLQIESPQVTRLKITQPHLPHYLPCSATVEVEDTLLLDGSNYLFVWYRNGVRLSTYVGRRSEFQIYANGTLRLPPNEKSHGVYRCMVNALKHAMLSESITVEFPMLKRISIQPNITVIVGMPLILNCPVFSVPQANFTWSYANDTLSKKFKENRYIALSNGSLIIKNVTQSDGGKYKCSAFNQFAVKSHRQFVWNVKILLTTKNSKNSSSVSTLLFRIYKIGELIPQLQETIQYVPQGESLKISCASFSDAIPIEWWFQQKTLSAIAEKISNNSRQIEIVAANIDKDEGYYTCSTKIDKQTFHVIVTIPPTIDDPLQSFESSLAASLTYSCRAHGNPEPEIIWYLNGRVINSTYTRIIKPNSLTIYSFDLEEEGIYQCFARNVAGETYTAGEVRLRRRDDATPNPLRNLRCYAHSFNTINVTFDSGSSPLYFISVHVVQEDPHRWESIGPLRLNHTSYVVISNHLPSYRPFVIITRALLATSLTRSSNKPNEEETILSSLRSMPVTCCTQGLLLHLVHFPDDLFITWSQPDIHSKKYFIVQFSINDTRPHPQTFLSAEQQQLQGTAVLVELNKEDVESKLIDVTPLNGTVSKEILNRAQSKYIDNESRDSDPGPDDEIFNIVLRANITGILLKNFTRAKVRVLIITSENEDLRQDFRYVQWKIIENDTAESSNVPFRLTTVESRSISLIFQETFNEDCVEVCYSISEFPIIRNDHQTCEEKLIVSQYLILRSLKPTKRYRMNFFSCQTQIFYGQLDVQTLPDPPGTISNQRVTRHNGLKLSWDPPLNPNGKIHHYNIKWMHHNVTHENNVLECTICFFKFPNVSETAKINVTVRVVGENGIGAPIYIDLRNIRHEQLEIENSTTKSDVYVGIIIGALLSLICIVVFATIIVCQKRRYKLRQGQTQLTSQSESNFGTISNPTIPGDSVGALSNMQHEYHEMQTLIPRSRNFQFLTERQSNEFLQQQTVTTTTKTTITATAAGMMTTKQQLPNGNGRCQRDETSYHLGSELDDSCVELIHQNASVTLLTSTPNASIENTARRRRRSSGSSCIRKSTAEPETSPLETTEISTLPYFIEINRPECCDAANKIPLAVATASAEVTAAAAAAVLSQSFSSPSEISINKISSSMNFFNGKNDVATVNRFTPPIRTFNNGNNGRCSNRRIQNGSNSSSSTTSATNSKQRNIPKHSNLCDPDSVGQMTEIDAPCIVGRRDSVNGHPRSTSQKSTYIQSESSAIENDVAVAAAATPDADSSIRFLYQSHHLPTINHSHNNNNTIHSENKLKSLNNTVTTTTTNSIPVADHTTTATTARTFFLHKTNSNSHSKSTIGPNTAATTTTATATTTGTMMASASSSNPIQCHNDEYHNSSSSSSDNSCSSSSSSSSNSQYQQVQAYLNTTIAGLVPPNILATASTNHYHHHNQSSMSKSNWIAMNHNHHHHQQQQQQKQQQQQQQQHSNPNHHNHQQPHHFHHHHRRPNVDPNG